MVNGTLIPVVGQVIDAILVQALRLNYASSRMLLLFPATAKARGGR